MDNQFLSIEPKKDTTITHKRQIERGSLSKAIYMVTNLFKEDEPLRSALRTASLNILTNDDIGHVIHLKNLLILSREISLISETNTNILLQGISNMKSLKEIGESVNLEKLLKSPEVEDIQDQDMPSIPFQPQMPIVKNETKVSHRLVLKNSEDVKKSSSQKPVISTVTTLDIGTRRKKILEVVKTKGQVTIHEFIQSIQGCSSKTIQRELTSLVLSGTLKKTGERRWSKYSLR